MPFCAQCGNQFSEGAAFCAKCGAPLPTTTPASSGAAPSPAPVASATVTGGSASAGLPMAENIAGMLAYFTIIPAIVFLVLEPYNRNRFVRFHSFQCLLTAGALIVIRIALGIFGMMLPLLVLPLWGLFGLACLALWVLLVIKAYQHEMFKLPVVGDLAEKQA